MPSRTVDVLVLGAGLAGLRAAWSCLAADPGLEVLVASQSSAPSGSSFANANNALGIQVCQDDQEREAFLSETANLAKPAWFDPRLAAIQAREGQDRLNDLLNIGLSFKRDQHGHLLGHDSCFSPKSRRAYIFTDLAQAHAAFMRRLKSLGCAFAQGLAPAAILRDPTRASQPVAGVLFMPVKHGQPLAISAKAVVVALGGPAGLFARAMSGPASPGYSYGLMGQAGVKLINTGFIQFMWTKQPEGGFWQPAEAVADGWKIITADDREIPIPDLIPDALDLASQRFGHCPFTYGQDDRKLDLTLADFFDDQGQSTLRMPDKSVTQVYPLAHAGNGGAIIDEMAETNVPGLLASGECATGMHGANRLGGGMVLATQVFGHRAGLRAAILAREGSACNQRIFRDLVQTRLNSIRVDENELSPGLKDLGRGLSRYAVFGGLPGLEEFRRELKVAEPAKDWRLGLCREAALTFLEELPVSS